MIEDDRVLQGGQNSCRIISNYLFEFHKGKCTFTRLVSDEHGKITMINLSKRSK